jgi:hypothetical protein
MLRRMRKGRSEGEKVRALLNAVPQREAADKCSNAAISVTDPDFDEQRAQAGVIAGYVSSQPQVSIHSDTTCHKCQ